MWMIAKSRAYLRGTLETIYIKNRCKQGKGDMIKKKQKNTANGWAYIICHTVKLATLISRRQVSLVMAAIVGRGTFYLRG